MVCQNNSFLYNRIKNCLDNDSTSRHCYHVTDRARNRRILKIDKVELIAYNSERLLESESQPQKKKTIFFW